MIQSGRLTQSVEIHAQSETLNELRERVNEWAKIANGDARAEVTLLKGDERETRGGQVEANQYRLRMYYHPDLTEAHRFEWNGRTLDIISIDNVDQMDQELIVTAEEVSRGGVQNR